MILKDDPKAYAIMGCAMRVHSILGYGFLESAYGDALEIEFKKAGIPYVREDGVRACTPRASKGAPSLKLRLRRRSRKRHLRPWKANHRREALTIPRSGSESHTDRSSSPRSRKANRKFAPATRMDV